MIRRRRSQTYKAAMLVLSLWLLLMQCALTYHSASVEKHKPGEQCELCVAAANFASAIPAEGGFDLPLFQAVSRVSTAAVFAYRLLFVTYAVRAPPSSAA
jgi:ABC-type uncharacterized transport system permease subunit